MADLKAALKLVKGAGITIPKKKKALKGGALEIIAGGAGDVFFIRDTETGQNRGGPYRSEREAQNELARMEQRTPPPQEQPQQQAPPAPRRGRVRGRLEMMEPAQQEQLRQRLAEANARFQAAMNEDDGEATESEESAEGEESEGSELSVEEPAAKRRKTGEGLKGGSVTMAVLGAIMGILAPYLPTDPVKKAVEIALKQVLSLMGVEFPPESIVGVIAPIVVKYLGRAAASVLREMTQVIKEIVTGSHRGGSRNSGFIQRMMAEVKKKHGGEPYGDNDADESYKNPTAPLAEDTTMRAPVAFDYFSMPSESRAMSKFIMDHFFKIRPYRAGEREELNEYELKKLRDAEAERQRRSRARRRGVGGTKKSGGFEMRQKNLQSLQ